MTQSVNAMEELLNAIQESRLDDNLTSQRERATQYKNQGRSNDCNREKRRKQWLEEYKSKRNDLLNEKRGLINNEFNEAKDGEWMDWQEVRKKSHKKWVNPHCKDQLMLSEWLMDRPSDLDTAWSCVLCPEGQHVLVVAKRGCTRAYHKSGQLLAIFKSILPNGSPKTRLNKGVTIVDCIWQLSNRLLFVLDVLHWNNQPLLNCDAQFRLYWLNSKLAEIKNSSQPKHGVYDVLLPPHCSTANLTSTLAENHPSKVDGVLFYHNSAPYVSGITPFVGWLKPYMLPERLNVDVPAEYLALKPDDYIDLEQWVTNVSHAHKRIPRRSGSKVDKNINPQELEKLNDSTNTNENVEHQTEDLMS